MGAREEEATVSQGEAKRGGEAMAHTNAAVHVLEPRQLSSLGSSSGTVQVAMSMVSLSSNLILISGLTMLKSTIIIIFQRSSTFEILFLRSPTLKVLQ
jgi:hypothetical protein